MYPPHTSRPDDQAQRLRDWVAGRRPDSTPSSPTHVIAVASGKGGVGKTLVSVNLSLALAARGQRVILFDMDMGLANADIVLGVEAAATWADMLQGRRSLDEVVVDAPGEIAFVAGSSGVARLANLSEFERHHLLAAMEEVERSYDVAVLDCGAGISDNVVGIAAAADTSLVVTTPEPTALTDAYAMIKAFALNARSAPLSQRACLGVLVNLAESRKEARQTYERLATVAADFLHLPVSDYGYILRDEHVPAAIRQRQPVLRRYPRCSASSCVMATAEILARELGQPEKEQGLFYRVMNLFV